VLDANYQVHSEAQDTGQGVCQTISITPELEGLLMMNWSFFLMLSEVICKTFNLLAFLSKV